MVHVHPFAQIIRIRYIYVTVGIVMLKKVKHHPPPPVSLLAVHVKVENCRCYTVIELYNLPVMQDKLCQHATYIYIIQS